jgi:hypothetical protein
MFSVPKRIAPEYAPVFFSNESVIIHVFVSSVPQRVREENARIDKACSFLSPFRGHVLYAFNYQ